MSSITWWIVIIYLNNKNVFNEWNNGGLCERTAHALFFFLLRRPLPRDVRRKSTSHWIQFARRRSWHRPTEECNMAALRNVLSQFRHTIYSSFLSVFRGKKSQIELQVTHSIIKSREVSLVKTFEDKLHGVTSPTLFPPAAFSDKTTQMVINVFDNLVLLSLLHFFRIRVVVGRGWWW